jgi:hypothetical protein
MLFNNVTWSAKIATIFGPNVLAISARNTKVYKLCKAIFSAFYKISQPNFAILLILVCSFREYTLFYIDFVLANIETLGKATKLLPSGVDHLSV